MVFDRYCSVDCRENTIMRISQQETVDQLFRITARRRIYRCTYRTDISYCNIAVRHIRHNTVDRCMYRKTERIFCCLSNFLSFFHDITDLHNRYCRCPDMLTELFLHLINNNDRLINRCLYIIFFETESRT